MQIYANPWPKTKQLSTEPSSAREGLSGQSTVARGPMPFCDIVLHNLHLQLQIALPNYRGSQCCGAVAIYHST